MKKTTSQLRKSPKKKTKTMIDGVIRFFVLIIPTCIFIEVIVQLHTVRKAQHMLRLVDRSLKVIVSKKISEHWKEKVLLAYSRKILGLTMVVFLCIVAALLGALTALALEWQAFLSSTQFMTWFDNKDAIISSCLIAVAYGWVRTRVYERALFRT
jgi:hypothetical protein